MSFDQNKDINIEMDDMNIKSHLNTSLEKGQISVSEDLINRTLQAIKNQTDEDTVKADHEDTTNKDKVIPMTRYVRRFAGVAAAALVLFAGFNAIKMISGIGMKGDRSNNAESAADDSSTGIELYGDENMGKEESKVYTKMTSEESQEAAEAPELTLGIAADEGDMEKADSVQMEEAGQTTEEDNKFSQDEFIASIQDNEYDDLKVTAGIRNKDEITFDMAFPIGLDKVKSIKIIDVSSSIEATLSEQISITDFYSVMSHHVFTVTTDQLDGNYYRIEVSGEEDQLIVEIGNNVAINYMIGDMTSYTVYNLADQEGFVQDIGKLLKKYK
ncbi:hypothetical protein I5677_00025 [Mobilitalea sibirica]|uniref:DUF4367 domain-containing protein n=1 Tax=Mobilitalea sibirica TaxID=1462919 RepID=A0A8J7H031_9FIRM|nr:hypothetical protein [Mobilitalea sibirica]MBH1939272.1 hypothetical protein [Mobilitalea sibirica]